MRNLNFYWQLKTQKTYEKVEWNPNITKRAVASGAMADGDAFVWFFVRKQDAEEARRIFRSKVENRGVKTYLVRKQMSDIECNSSSLGQC